jgi:hypothetical protein
VISAATNCTDEGIVQLCRMQRQANEAALLSRLQRALDEGELPPTADAAALAKLVATLVQGMSVQARDGASQAELLATVELAMRAWPGAATQSA